MKTEPDLLVQIQDQPALTSRLKSYGLQRPVLFGSCLLPHHLLLSPWLSELQLCCHVSSSNKKRFFPAKDHCICSRPCLRGSSYTGNFCCNSGLSLDGFWDTYLDHSNLKLFPHFLLLIVLKELSEIILLITLLLYNILSSSTRVGTMFVLHIAISLSVKHLWNRVLDSFPKQCTEVINNLGKIRVQQSVKYQINFSHLKHWKAG